MAYDYSCADRDHLRDVSWEYVFKPGASAAASEFCEWVQVGTDVCIPHRKCQVKPHLSPWFSAACTAAIVHRNHFFCLCQKVIVAKGFLKLTNLCMLIKQKSPLLSRNLTLATFGELLIVFSTKVNLLYPPLFNGP